MTECRSCGYGAGPKGICQSCADASELAALRHLIDEITVLLDFWEVPHKVRGFIGWGESDDVDLSVSQRVNLVLMMTSRESKEEWVGEREWIVRDGR